MNSRALAAAVLMAFLGTVATAPSVRALSVFTELSPPSAQMENGALTGLGVDIVREIQKRTGDATPIELLPWARAYAMAVARPDIVLFATTRTPERAPLFHWIGPIMRLKWAFYAPAGKMKPLASLDEAKTVGSIGTYNGDARERFLLDHGFTNLDSANTPVANVKKLLAGRLDLIASTDMGIRFGTQRACLKPGQLENVYTFQAVDLYIAFSKGSDEAVVTAWNEALADMKADGTFQAIYSRWLPGEAVPE
ncbi:substrate-binding periplasmic protein [Fundidesulfovibrio terrae]|uniref:substrate-binding periplasmic protein n=1 Tax=Fundidesulfovibrio terrae TaxID=2922866 RepID=UPI001FAEB349|nr:ABC transporter substrate-binding protein [Fundidesulfovibrio terrae]